MDARLFIGVKEMHEELARLILALVDTKVTIAVQGLTQDMFEQAEDLEGQIYELVVALDAREEE